MGKSGPKLLDANAKLIAEFDFEGLLLLMGVEPGARIVKVEEIEREITLPQMRIDHGAKLTLELNRGRVVYVIEFLARWKSAAPLRLRRYSRAGEIKHACPVNCILVVCTSFGAPKTIPARHSFGDLDRHPFDFTVFCPWKIPGEQILSMNRPRLLPLVALAEPNVENLREARRRLSGETAHEDLVRLRSFSDVYYSQEQILELFGEEQGMIDEVILQESSWFRGILKRAKADARTAHDEGVREGHGQGLREGELRERREMIRAILARRFPDLRVLPDVQRLDYEAAGAVLFELLDAADSAAARKIIRRHAAKPRDGFKP